MQQKKVIEVQELFYDSEILGGRIDFEKVSPAKVMDIMQEIADGSNDVYNASLYLIYLSVPMFRSKQLQEKYEIKDNPYKVIEYIFEENILEITNFGAKILNIYGFSQKRLDTLKK